MANTIQQTDSSIEVVARDTGTRRIPATRVRVDDLAENVRLFIEQVGLLVNKAPAAIGPFHFAELEVHAEVSAKGSLSLLGTGGEAGATGGLKFVFRRMPGDGR
jgi:hypothetical protein